ncbi:MAG: flippase-like domain-containing protein [Actinobacteria bacterium]|nr:flippase-like domain-containing protein [Actinomycetota bacterium]
MSAPPLGFDPGSSLDSFLRAADEFFDRIGDIGWPALALALAFYLAHLLARTRAWQNVLRAAYPETEVSYAKITASYLAGAGLNSFIPARVGDAVKIFLAKKSIRGSSYPAITSSFFVQSVFDTTAGVLVFLFALTQGLLPAAPEIPDLPAFEISFWAENPDLLVFFVTALVIALVVLFAVLARRAERFWEKIKQGVVVLTDIPRYLREVALWQGIGWVLRFFAFWFFLEAFHIGGSFENVAVVMSVQAVATVLPFTPGGAGAQQALLVATLAGPGPIAVLTYSVGQQIAIAVWAAILGFLALGFVFRTLDWRSLIRSAGAEAEEHRRREQARSQSG